MTQRFLVFNLCFICLISLFSTTLEGGFYCVILQWWKLKVRKVKDFSWSHTTKKQQSRGSEVCLPVSSSRQEPLWRAASCPLLLCLVARIRAAMNVSSPFLFHTLMAFQHFMNLLMNLPDLTPKYLRTPKASAEKCACF